MADGSQKSIEDIKVGDVVTSYDEKKMAKTSAKVTEMFDGERAKEYLLVNNSLKVTPNHKFYSQGKWVEIGELKEGDLLFDEDGNEVPITKIEKVETQNDIQVYNLEVEGEHNYYVVTSAASATSEIHARGVLVHNKLSYNPPAVSGVPVTSGVITRYIGSLAEETKGTWVNKVFLGSTQIATVSSDAVRYYYQDHLGSTNVVTDAAGTRIELMEYKPFGDFSRHDKFGGTENVAWYYFTGKPLDDETGLMFYGARYYSPLLGRFITADTVVQAPMNPQTLNRYTYCNNNPVNFVDPNGNSWWKKLWGGVKDFFRDYGGLFGLTGNFMNGVINGDWKPLKNQLIAGASAFLFSGFNPVAGAAAILTTGFLDSKPGRQVTGFVASEIMDDILGMRPGSAYVWSRVTLQIVGTLSVENAMKGAIGSPVTKSAKYDANDPVQKSMTDRPRGFEPSGGRIPGGENVPEYSPGGFELNQMISLTVKGQANPTAVFGGVYFGPNMLHTGVISSGFPISGLQRLTFGNTFLNGYATVFGVCHQASNATLLASGISSTVWDIMPHWSTFTTTIVYGNYGGQLPNYVHNGIRTDRKI